MNEVNAATLSTISNHSSNSMSLASMSLATQLITTLIHACITLKYFQLRGSLLTNLSHQNIVNSKKNLKLFTGGGYVRAYPPPLSPPLPRLP